MIEMLGVLAIIGVLSAGGVWGYNSAMTSHKTNKLIADVQTMISQFDYVYNKRQKGGVYSYIAVDTASGRDKLYALGILPADYYKKAKISNMGLSPFNTLMPIVIYQNYGGKDSTFLYLRVDNLPKSACVKILTTDWRKTGKKVSVRSSGYVEVFPNSDRKSPRTLGQAEIECGYESSNITGGENNKIRVDWSIAAN